MKYILSLLIMTLAVILTAAEPQTVPIIVSTDAIPAEHTAAKELQNGLKQIFGKEFPIITDSSASPAIRIGQSPENAKLLGIDFGTLKPDEIILKRVGYDLVLTGERPRGSLYAVYELLEQVYGVRFWTAAVTHYPRLDQFMMPDIDYRYAPVFRDRKTNYELPRFPVFAVRMRINHDFYMPRRHPSIPNEWGGYHFISGYVHTFLQLIPHKEYFASHPEYFAEFGGFRDSRKDAQLCMTNLELRKEIIGKVLQRLKDNPAIKVVSLSPSDSLRFCQCSNCRDFIREHGNLTDLLMDFVNTVARVVAKEFPQVKIETLAYRSTRKPPMKILPDSNVIIRLCPIECDMARPLDSTANAGFAEELRKWHKIAPELWIWNYVTNFTQFYRPHPNLKNIGFDLQFFAANGVTSIYEQGFTRHSKNTDSAGIADLSDLRTYLICKLLWNPNLDSNRIIDEFLTGFYGPAASDIRKYIDIINNAPSKYPAAKVDCYSVSTSGWLDEDDLIAAWQAMEQARKSVKGNDLLEKRLNIIALSINMTLLERFEIWRKPLEERRPELKSVDWRKLLDDQLKIAETSGINNFAEHDPLSSFDGTRKRISRDILGPAGGPKEPASLTGRKWYALPAATEAKIFEENRYSFRTDDPASSIGKVIRMNTERASWWVQVNQPPEGHFEIYAEVRCDSSQPSGNAMTLGYIDYNNKRIHKFVNVPAAKIAGQSYQLIKMGEASIKASYCLYAAPVINQAVKNVWIDRFILVEK